MRSLAATIAGRPAVLAALALLAALAAPALAPRNSFATAYGLTWAVPRPVGTSLRGVAFADADHGWAVGDFGTVLRTADGGATWQDLSRYPAVEQDLALVVDEGVMAGRVQRIIESSALVASARVFDVFRGERLGEGKKSFAFSIRYQAADRTLTTEDANREQARLVRRLQHELGAEPRG